MHYCVHERSAPLLVSEGLQHGVRELKATILRQHTLSSRPNVSVSLPKVLLATHVRNRTGYTNETVGEPIGQRSSCSNDLPNLTALTADSLYAAR